MGRASHYEEHKDKVLESIAKLTRQEGRAPSLRQVSADVGVGVATLHAYLVRLRDEGLIDWIERTHRSLRVRPQGQSVTPAPTAPAPQQTSPVSQPQPTPPPPPVKVDPNLDVGF